MVLKLAKVGDWFTFKTGINSFANIVKLSVKPLSYRKYDKNTGQWHVHKTKLKELLGLAGKFYSEIDMGDVPAVWIEGDVAKDDTVFAKLFLTDEAPIEVVRAVYERLVTLYHPDHNEGAGNTTRLQEVIKAYRTICKSMKS